MNINHIQLWPLLAGLGLFLFGMFMLEESLQKLAGRSFKKFLRRQTGNPVKAVAAGCLVTAILQSSSMVTLLVMSFAGAGIIGLNSGIGMIMGANLGTTVTGWLVSLIGFKLNIGEIILPFIAIGGLGIIFLKSEKLSHISKAIMGFSLMFLGLDYMKDGFIEFSEHFDFSSLSNKSPFLFLLTGVLLSATIQSSSASMMIFLSSLSAGIITIESAIYLAIGADLGTTTTAIIGTFRANSIKKKVGWSQFFFNVFTSLLAILFNGVYLYFINDVLNIKDPLFTLVAFHSTMNIAGIILMLPLLKVFTKFINVIITEKKLNLAQKIMLVNPAETHAATEALHHEADAFINKTISLLYSFFSLTYQRDTSNHIRTYNDLKDYEGEIVTFYTRLQQNTLTAEEAGNINALIAVIRNAALSAKDLKDIKHNLDELINSPQDDLYELYIKIRDNQKLFYEQVSNMLQRLSNFAEADLTKLEEIKSSYYQNASNEIYGLIGAKKYREIAIPSMLNMIHEINSSNESLLRSLHNLIISKSLKTS